MLGLYRNIHALQYYNIVLTDTGLYVAIDTTGGKGCDSDFSESIGWTCERLF